MHEVRVEGADAFIVHLLRWRLEPDALHVEGADAFAVRFNCFVAALRDLNVDAKGECKPDAFFSFRLDGIRVPFRLQ